MARLQRVNPNKEFVFKLIKNGEVLSQDAFYRKLLIPFRDLEKAEKIKLNRLKSNYVPVELKIQKVYLENENCVETKRVVKIEYKETIKA